MFLSKVVSTHLWNTPLNLLPTGYEGIPFIVGLGDCLGCALMVFVAIFLDFIFSNGEKNPIDKAILKRGL